MATTAPILVQKESHAHNNEEDDQVLDKGIGLPSQDDAKQQHWNGLGRFSQNLRKGEECPDNVRCILDTYSLAKLTQQFAKHKQ